jgi:hypothetical protein
MPGAWWRGWVQPIGRLRYSLLALCAVAFSTIAVTYNLANSYHFVRSSCHPRSGMRLQPGQRPAAEPRDLYANRTETGAGSGLAHSLVSITR